MIAAFLLPFPFRGYRAPYLWVFYRLLHSLDEKMLFLAGRDYVVPPGQWVRQGRWEMLEQSQRRLDYTIPSAEMLSRHGYAFLSDGISDELLAANAGNPVAAFRQLLCEPVPHLEDAFAEALAGYGSGGVEAILSWCNCPSLNRVAAGLGIPVVHLELGPLRQPSFKPTAYLDFSGVNGNTEAEARYLHSGFEAGGVDASRLLEFFYTGEPIEPRAAEYEAGVVLQVEDDSNLVAFGNGFDNMALLVRTHLQHPEGSTLARAHPGSLFGLKKGWYTLDDSPDSIRFVRRCRRVYTINSSVGLEALLLGVPVTAYGDSSYRFIAEAEDERERLRRLAFYLFAYLVPQDLIYDPAYLRFRLSGPPESAIVRRHLQAIGIDYDQWAAEFRVGWIRK